MSKMYIERSIDIAAPAEKIFKHLNDFNNWSAWSPWLLMDENPTVTVADDTKSYEWEGKRTGSGNMKITSEEENKSLEMDLNFLKPWKSFARVGFTLVENGDTTKVTWTMDSSWPFFLFFMKKTTMAFIGSDYERGLSMLQALIETGSVPSKLEFKGRSSFEGCTYIGITQEIDIDETENQMPLDFGRISGLAEKHSAKVSGTPMTVYHKWDLVKNIVSYTAALPVSVVPEGLDSDIVTGSIPATDINTIRHIGRYQHLGNAWTTGYTMNRLKEFKFKKGIHPFEIYRNNPREVAETELITDVNFAIK